MTQAKFTYHTLGGTKRICDIVFAGSHDAGITSGFGPTKAQSLSIHMQAVVGSRFFDVRIGAFSGSNGTKLKTFHAGNILQFNRRSNATVIGSQTSKQTNVKKMSLPIGGSSGQHLTDLLTGAMNFVQANKTEFVVLNFSKSTNMDLVLPEIDRVLGDYQYGVPGSLNTKTLDEVKGRVICVYAEPGDEKLEITSYQNHAFGAEDAASRYTMKNLFKTGGGYDKTVNGFQYYGKGGMTDALWGEQNKINSNAGLQKAKILAGSKVQGCQEVIGMIYITATGGIGSIKDRDKKLWKEKRLNPILNIWESKQLVETINALAPTSVALNQPSGVAAIKKFFPNIVMIDFVSEKRCQTIYNINIESTGPMGESAPRSLSRSASQP